MGSGFLEPWPLWNAALRRESRSGFFAVVAAILIFTMTPIYLITNHLMDWRDTTVWDPSTSLDTSIPFIAWSMIFYQSLFFLFYPLPFYAMPDTTEARRDTLIASQGLLTLTVISNLIFVLFPCEIFIREQAVAGIAGANPLLVSAFEYQWWIDSPYNAWPSLHISTSGMFTLFALRWWKGQPVKQWIIGILWLLMALSILTTKQHFVWDLVTALALLAAVWHWQMRPALAA